LANPSAGFSNPAGASATPLSSGKKKKITLILNNLKFKAMIQMLGFGEGISGLNILLKVIFWGCLLSNWNLCLRMGKRLFRFWLGMGALD